MKIPVKVYDHKLGRHKDFGVHNIEDLDALIQAFRHWGLNNEDDEDLEADNLFGQFRLGTGDEPAFFEITSM